LDELVHFDGVVVRDGVRGGSNGALYRQRWTEGADQDEFFRESICHCCWLQIKQVMKLCNNKTQGVPNYDLAYKYDMFYDTLIESPKAITEEAELDLCVDETT
jgi:hypothetical protein